MGLHNLPVGTVQRKRGINFCFRNHKYVTIFANCVVYIKLCKDQLVDVFRASRSISAFEFDEVLCISSDVGSSAIGLWSELQKESD